MEGLSASLLTAMEACPRHSSLSRRLCVQNPDTAFSLKHKRPLVSGDKLRVAGGERVGGMGWLGEGHWGGHVLWGAQ